MTGRKNSNTGLFFAVALCLIAGACRSAETESEVRHITVDGHERSYLLYRPQSATREAPAPLVVVLHGGFGSGSQAEHSYGGDALADKRGFVVAYPDGIRRSWNAGSICCGRAAKEKVDDVGFITALIHEVSKAENIDPRRVYLTGISNGAALSYRYACEGSYPIAAIGTVSGSMSFACRHPHALSVMEIHGMDDQNIPIMGGRGPRGVTRVEWQPVRNVLDGFSKAAHCTPAPVYTDSAVTTAISTCPDNREIELITIDGAGHQWPGGKPHGILAGELLHLDPPSKALDATTTLWNFFHRHSSDR